jgi:3-oxoacyl-[acyl-carrier protein] reductase
MSLRGKIAVITGASRGIGRAIALSMAKAGASVVVNYQKNAEAAATVIREIEAMHEHAISVQGDVGSVAGIRQFFQALDAELTKRHGSPHFDVLVNNAGIGRGGTVETTSEKELDELMAVNVKGSFFVTQEALSRLRDGGRIINLSSALSKHAYPRMTAYSMGKAAINQFTVILAADLGKRGITVNCIAPGLRPASRRCGCSTRIWRSNDGQGTRVRRLRDALRRSFRGWSVRRGVSGPRACRDGLVANHAA